VRTTFSGGTTDALSFVDVTGVEVTGLPRTNVREGNDNAEDGVIILEVDDEAIGGTKGVPTKRVVRDVFVISVG
jgi:hypothetical protein